jgi:hypothetical protein
MSFLLGTAAVNQHLVELFIGQDLPMLCSINCINYHLTFLNTYQKFVIFLRLQSYPNRYTALSFRQLPGVFLLEHTTQEILASFEAMP